MTYILELEYCLFLLLLSSPRNSAFAHKLLQTLHCSYILHSLSKVLKKSFFFSPQNFCSQIFWESTKLLQKHWNIIFFSHFTFFSPSPCLFRGFVINSTKVAKQLHFVASTIDLVYYHFYAFSQWRNKLVYLKLFVVDNSIMKAGILISHLFASVSCLIREPQCCRF